MSDTIQMQLVTLLPRLRRFAFTLTGTLDEADDVVQSACERALAKRDQFDPATRLDSWMFTIVRNVVIDRSRRGKLRRAEALDDVEGEAGFDARIEEQTAARQDLKRVQQEYRRLPEEQQTLIAMIAIDGVSYQEAASTLNIPIGTVMSRLSRARRRLAAAVSDESGRTRNAESEIDR